MRNYILGLPGNILDLIGRLTGELTEYISDIFSLLSTVSHTEVEHYGIQNSKGYVEEYAIMDDAMISSQYTVWIMSLWKRDYLMMRWTIWRIPGRD